MGLISPVSIVGFIFSINSLLYLIFVDSSSFFAIYISMLFILYLIVYWLISSKIISKKPKRKVRISYKLYGEGAVLTLGVLSGSYAILLLIVNSGQSDLLTIASHYSKLRYMEDVGMPMEVRVANVFLYFSLMVSSLIFFEKKRFLERSFLYAFPAILLILESFLLGTKSILIMVAVYFLTSYFMVNLYHGYTLGSAKKFVKMLFYAFVVFALVLITHYVRASGNMAVSDIIVKIFTSYFLIPSFAFIQEAGNIEQLFDIGARSVSGVSVYIDDDIVKRGDFIYFNVFGGVYHTNVYTAMFYLVKDFGHVGFFILMLLFLFLSLYFEERIRRGAVFVGSLYITLSAFLIFSFADPLFKELTNVLSHFLLILYFFISSLMYRPRNKSYFVEKQR